MELGGQEQKYISLSEAARLCQYSQEYLGLRARQGRLKAIKIGRNWMTTEAWLRDYIVHCEDYYGGLSQKTKIKPKSALSDKKPKAEVPQKSKREAINPEIIPNFWISLFKRVKLGFVPDIKTFRSGGVGSRRQDRTYGMKWLEEIKLSVNSFRNLVTFINVWFAEERPRVKIGSLLAGLSVMATVFGMLTLVTNSQVQDKIGSGALSAVDYAVGLAGQGQQDFGRIKAGLADVTYPALVSATKQASQAAAEIWQGASTSANEFYSDGLALLVKANEKLPVSAGNFGVAIWEGSGHSGQWPQLALNWGIQKKSELVDRLAAISAPFKKQFKTNQESIAIASRLLFEEVDTYFAAVSRVINTATENLGKAGGGFGENLSGRGEKFFAGIANFSAGIENKILTSRQKLFAAASGFLKTILNVPIKLDGFADGLKNLFAVPIVTQQLQVGSAENPNGITVFDEESSQPYCIKVKAGQVVNFPGRCVNSAGSENLKNENATMDNMLNIER
ncbi:MAG: hypothetical protein V1845_00745 [bacterium]